MTETAAPRTRTKTDRDARGFGRFWIPGPTEVRPEILEAQLLPMIGHRGTDMEELLAAIQPGLQQVFRTKRPVYISTSSGTGMMEAAVRNGARQRVLCFVNGAFSDRFYRIAAACGLDATAVRLPLGAAPTPDRLRDELKMGDYDAVTVVHSETSTGALAPIRELAGVVREHEDVMLLVDSVSGLAGAVVETDAWKLDVLLTGSQKALALPPGLAFTVAQERVLERAKTKTDRGIYFDYLEFEANVRKNQTPNTPAVSLLYVLRAQLQRITAETIERRWERHHSMARRMWAWVDEMQARGVAIEILAPPGYRSPTVTCLRLPQGRTGPGVVSAVKNRGFIIATGYGEMKDVAIRIGHMGDHTEDELDALLEVLADTLTR